MLQPINFNSFLWPQSVFQSPSFQIHFLPPVISLILVHCVAAGRALKAHHLVLVRACVSSELKFRSSVIKMFFFCGQKQEFWSGGMCQAVKQSIWLWSLDWNKGLQAKNWESNQSNRSNKVYTQCFFFFLSSFPQNIHILYVWKLGCNNTFSSQVNVKENKTSLCWILMPKKGRILLNVVFNTLKCWK